MWRPLLVILAALSASGSFVSCETTTRSVPVFGDFGITHTTATRAWFVVDEGEAIGELVRFEEEQGGRFFYSVRNRLHQEFGLIDEAGRAYRFRAHQPEPTWVSTGAVVEGVREILGSGASTTLREVPLADLTRTD